MTQPKPKKRACSQCGKPNAVIPARLCPTCKRLNKKASSAAAHEKYVIATYGLSTGDYKKLYEAQGGKCAICRRATGAARRLSVDHDHSKTGIDSVRGLLCKSCNYNLLGKIARDDTTILQNAIDYLNSPPARKVLGLDTDGSKQGSGSD